MIVTIDTGDLRSIKAITIAAGARQWLKFRGRDGQKAYGIPSQRGAGVFHLANCHECTCFDFRHRKLPCKHVLAVQLHCALVRAQRKTPTRDRTPSRRQSPDGRPNEQCQ